MARLQTLTRFLVFLAAGTLCAQQSFPLYAPAPPPPSTISARASQSGLGSYCYWIIATYPIGKSTASLPTCINQAAGTVTINWSVAPGASTYDVLRTTTPLLPAGTSNIAVATAVSGTSQTDTLGAASSYTLGPSAPSASVNFSLINSTYPTPIVQINQPMLFPPAAFVVAKLPPAVLFAGYEVIATDGMSGTDCTVGGGSTAALCYATGGAWTSIGGGGGGSGTVTSVGFTGGLISVGTATTTPAFTVAGTNGGIPYFSGPATWASSAAGVAGNFILWGGAGVAPADAGFGISALPLLNPAGGVNTYTVGTRNVLQASATTDPLTILGAANGSSPNAGDINIDASGGFNWRPNTSGWITLAASPTATRTVSIPDAASNTVQGIANPSDTEAVNYIDTSGVQHRISIAGLPAHYWVAGAFTGVGPAMFTPVTPYTFTMFDNTASTGATRIAIQLGAAAGQSGATSVTNLVQILSNAGSPLTGGIGTDASNTTASFYGTINDPSQGWNINANNWSLGSGTFLQFQSGVHYYDGSDVGLKRNAANIIEIDNGAAGNYNAGLKTGYYVVAGTVPGIAGTGGFSTVLAPTGGATAGNFVATSSAAGTVTLTFALTAPTGWSCDFHDITTTGDLINPTGGSQTTATASGTVVSGDNIRYSCIAY